MLRNISRELSTLLAAKKIISIENVDAYAYGLELFLFKSVFYLLVFILSLLSGTLLISALFVIIYLGLRQYSGGYHCKTYQIGDSNIHPCTCNAYASYCNAMHSPCHEAKDMFNAASDSGFPAVIHFLL